MCMRTLPIIHSSRVLMTVSQDRRLCVPQRRVGPGQLGELAGLAVMHIHRDTIGADSNCDAWNTITPDKLESIRLASWIAREN